MLVRKVDMSPGQTEMTFSLAGGTHQPWWPAGGELRKAGPAQPHWEWRCAAWVRRRLSERAGARGHGRKKIKTDEAHSTLEWWIHVGMHLSNRTVQQRDPQCKWGLINCDKGTTLIGGPTGTRVLSAFFCEPKTAPKSKIYSSVF